MNIKNVKIAISVMERVKSKGGKFTPYIWQEFSPTYTTEELRKQVSDITDGKVVVASNNNTNQDPHAYKTEQELYDNEAAASLAGWIAVSPEFQKQGGYVYETGEPHIKINNSWTCDANETLVKWLDIEPVEAEALNDMCVLAVSETLYGKHLDDVTIDDIVSVLHRLHDTGSIFTAKMREQLKGVI